jgi:carboxyl-terminal processing protease
MKNLLVRLKQAAARQSERIRSARFTTFQALVGAVVVLVAGIGVGGTTTLWNDGFRTLGLKPNVRAIDLSSLETTYETLAAHYDGKLDTAKLIDGANHGLVAAAANPYTLYFNQSEVSSFNSDLNGTFSGIGVELAFRNSVLTVQSVLDASPAKAAGLQTGDQITAIDGKATDGLSIEAAVGKIKGVSGSTVTLTILRSDTTKDYVIARAALTNPSVKSQITDGGIGILTINRFGDDANGQNTGTLAQKAAKDFKDKGVKGIILDLRGNGGGYVNDAQTVASLWLNNKTIVSERTDGKVTDTLRSEGSPVLSGIPTVVLIDGGSASASEIVAGALHDNKAATLIGQQSFGKGSYQDVFNLPGGNEIKVTVGRWYTPNGANIDKQGITPDTVITPTDAQLQAGSDPVKDAALAKLGA